MITKAYEAELFCSIVERGSLSQTSMASTKQYNRKFLKDTSD